MPSNLDLLCDIRNKLINVEDKVKKISLYMEREDASPGEKCK